MKLISVDALKRIAKDVTLANGAKHRCVDATQIHELKPENDRILKIIWDTLHEGLSIDTVADQDYVYEKIRQRIEKV